MFFHFQTDNNIGDEARCLINALKSNSTLKEIKLNGNEIKRFSSLSLILLSFLGNNISENVMALIQKEVKRNSNSKLAREKNKAIELKNKGLVKINSCILLSFSAQV